MRQLGLGMPWNRWLDDSSPSGFLVASLDRGEQAVPERQQYRDEPVVRPHLAGEVERGITVPFIRSGVLGRTGQQGVIEGNDAAGPQQTLRGGQVIRIVSRVRVAEHHVVGAVG